MIKRFPQPIISEKNEYENQFYDWLSNSHYWIQKSNTVFVCKWCEKLMPMSLKESRLCINNPEILKIRFKEDNPIFAKND